jgi:Tol biopolymer transport system component
VWLDSSGTIHPLLKTPGSYYFPRISPDGGRLALTVSSKESDVFVYNWQGDTRTRVTFDQHRL